MHPSPSLSMKTSRPTVRLNPKLHKNLLSYAAAATAAGIGAAGPAQTAEAKIVYHPANIAINVNGGTVNLDLNHDGIIDFQFYASYQGPAMPHRLPEGTHGSALRVGPAQKANRVIDVYSQKIFCAAALPKGRRVGPGGHFQGGDSSLLMAEAFGDSTNGGAGCPWLNYKTRAYLGVKFVIKGKIHFGWVRIKRVSSDAGFPAVITGYAYETIPNKAILTGATKGEDDAYAEIADSLPADRNASLGLLAQGAGALTIWRREAQASV